MNGGDDRDSERLPAVRTRKSVIIVMSSSLTPEQWSGVIIAPPIPDGVGRQIVVPDMKRIPLRSA
jgi:hypothetical protein